MTVLADETITTGEAARQLGVNYRTVSRWVRLWHPPVGHGNRLRVTRTDMLVMAAWKVINGQSGHNGYWGTNPHLLRQLCAIAETAIRRRPQQWLAISPQWGETFPAGEAAAAGWLSLPRPRPACTFIDLELRP